MKKKRISETRDGGVPPKLMVLREDALEKIESQIEKGKKLLGSPMSDEDSIERFLASPSEEGFKAAQKEYLKWDDYNIALLRKLFDSNEIANEYDQSLGDAIGSMDSTLGELVKDFREDFEGQINRLESIKERLPLFEDPSSSHLVTEEHSGSIGYGSKVFIVHGRDEAIKETTARFMEKLGLHPVILHEQPNRGRTIIEKFEHHSTVAYSVVILTGDDLGALSSEQSKFSPRARQNVVFELGYFIGKLGRERVCALYQDGVELPSDFEGVLYIPLDTAGRWKLSLAQELQASGFSIDLNEAF